jgi:hypothetical protein
VSVPLHVEAKPKATSEEYQKSTPQEDQLASASVKAILATKVTHAFVRFMAVV